MTIGTWLNELNTRSGTAVEYKEDGTWHQLSWSEYLHRIIYIAEFLEKKNLKKKQHVGIISSTRWEWAAVDIAILGSGCVCVPMYPNLSDDDLTFTINHSEVSILVIENESQKKQIERIQSKLEKKPVIIQFNDFDFTIEASSSFKTTFIKKCTQIKLSDTATIVYTSGTTGQPKGAVLLHSAIVSEITESFALFGIKAHQKALTFLPFAHVLGRIEH